MADKTAKIDMAPKAGRQPNEIRRAAEFGIDISMLIDNIRRSPSERIKRHQIALNTAEKLSKARTK